MRMIIPQRGALDLQTVKTKEFLSFDMAEQLMGRDFKCYVFRFTEDFILVGHDWKDYVNRPINKNATALIGEPVYGPAILLDVDEFDFQDFRKRGGVQAVNRRGGQRNADHGSHCIGSLAL